MKGWRSKDKTGEKRMKRKTGINFTTMLLGAVLLAGPAVMARAAQEPDNTKTNQRDRDKNSVTADQQKMNPADRETTKKIRAAIHDDKSLSTYASNIKVITRDGKVTLKGPVRTEEEKNSIAAKAAAVAGDGSVTNEIEVTPAKQ
jgi:hyperosmotically inducible protein